jgi:hypothetical protein
MRRLIVSSTCLCLLTFASLRGEAQPGAAAENAALLESRWNATLNQVLAERGLILVDGSGKPVTIAKTAMRVSGDPVAVREAYVDAIQRLLADPQLAVFFRVDPTLVDEVSERTDQEWVARLAAEIPREKGAKSTSSTLTNPAAPQGAERSGFADLVSLALDAQNFVAADKAAVTINLSALALIGLTDQTRSAQAMYREHDALRRLGGSFTFGAKIPEKEITGFSGLPSAETLLDAIGWDVKYRLYGDRDPRAMRWYKVMLGDLGGLTEIAANL